MLKYSRDNIIHLPLLCDIHNYFNVKVISLITPKNNEQTSDSSNQKSR